MIAFSWLTYQITGSATWSAIIVGMNQLVSVLFQPVIGSIVEGLNKKKVMVYADSLRFLTILGFYLAYRMGMDNPALLCCFTVVVSFIETFRIPAGVSIIPKLLMAEDYDQGISINNFSSKLSELVGLFSATTLITYLGAEGSIMVDGLTFLISSIIIASIPYRHETPSTNTIRRDYLRMTVEGARFLWTQKSLLIICVICGLINASVTPFGSLQSAYIRLYFDAKVQILSAVSITVSIGMLLGSVLYRSLPSRYVNSSILTIGGIVLGLFYLIAYGVSYVGAEMSKNAFAFRVIILVISAFSIGIELAFMNNYVQIYFIREVSQAFLSRISAISTTITTVMSPITAFFIGLMATIFETRTIFLAWGVAVIIGFLLLCRGLKKDRTGKS